MEWTVKILNSASDGDIIRIVQGLVESLGFKEAERVRAKEWKIDFIALREDPISGLEKYAIKVKTKGLASSKEVEEFAEAIIKAKADRGIFLSVSGFTKDAKVLLEREYKGKIIPWDGERLVKELNDKKIPVAYELVERLKKEEMGKEEEKRMGMLKVIRLDAPLLYSFSPNKVLERVVSVIESRYKIKREDIFLEELVVELSTGYVILWSAKKDTKEVKDKAVVLSREEVIPFVSGDVELERKVSRALLESESTIKASEVEITSAISQNEAVIALKLKLADELETPQTNIYLSSRRKVYVPKKALLNLKVGINSAKAEVDLKTNDIKINMAPLPKEKLVEIAREECKKYLGEDTEEISVEEKDSVAIISGQTKRFVFRIALHVYSGRVVKRKSKMKREAIFSEIAKLYPDGEVIFFDEKENRAIVDVMTPKEVVVLEFNLENGGHRVVANLIHPYQIANSARNIIERNFDIKGLELVDFKLHNTTHLELLLESVDGKIKVNADGKTGDIIDYFVEISPQKAREVILQKYKGWEIKKLEKNEAYEAELENDKSILRISLSKDGKILNELDRRLKIDVVREIAEKFLKEKGISATIKEIKLNENWLIKFVGEERVGELVIGRSSGEILKSDVFLTEIAIEESYKRYILEKFNEKNLNTERIVLYKEKGYAVIKLIGDKSVYYAKIDLRSGKILEEDRLPRKGLMAKIKKIQLEAKYK
ncbi:Chromosome partition protein smc [Thermococcus sp. 2319x1]|uniref:restriction endonuclease n=1 Tax=Thermococcus sp. 2319x1 TaxID=1674923 RepID=UPI00073A99CC|nr:restriction endonuclease [Thermococcus sp. 2319x1]ALV61854.1 Chromosome partition protein smc [Thermococcus sp. 2319x1]